jgi:iron(III) transport system permease protein
VAAWGAALLCLLPVLAGFVLPVLLLLRAAAGQGVWLDARLVQWSFNTALLSGLAVAVVVPLALALAYAVRQSRYAVLVFC